MSDFWTRTVIEQAIKKAVDERENAAFQRGVERGKFEQSAESRAERDQLRAELEKLRCELDDAEERASEAEERCAAEWEKDCGQALRLLAQVTKFEWDQDGSPADEVREHIQITIESLEKQVVALRAELAAAKSLLARIHRDGGHHTEAVGVINSITDAHEKWSELLLENFNLTNELATARETIASAQEEIAAMCTERNATATDGDVVFKIQEAQRYGKG